MKAIYTLLTAITILTLHVVPALACNNDSQCGDGNSCTVDYCQFFNCHHTNVAYGAPCNDGSSCTTNDYCSSGVCFGGPPPQEVCTGSGINVDEDCDGLTDENVPQETSTCEAPTGVFEMNNWFKLRPVSTAIPELQISNIPPGSSCNWGVECSSGACMKKNGSVAVCGMRNEVTPPTGWVIAFREPGGCSTSYRTLAAMYVPPIAGWSTPNPLHGFNQSCNSNADCTTSICIRKSLSGLCGVTYYSGNCLGSIAYVSNFDELYYDVGGTTVCIPSAATCSPVAADPCTWNGYVWDCP